MSIKKMVYNIILLSLIVLSSKVAAAFFEQHAEGWHWYQAPIAEFKEEPEPEQPILSTPTEVLNAYKKELERRLHLAWVTPTYHNIKSYQEMQWDLMQRSHNFANTWMQVVYQNPALDYTLVAPVDQTARHIYLDQKQHSIKAAIYNLQQQYGLFFFFSSQCAYCHQFAPIVQQFAKKYDWEVMAISMDGGLVSGFNNVVPDNGLAAKLKLEVLPALFAVDPKTEQLMPIAYGLTSVEEIETRIMKLLEVKHDNI